MKKLIGICRVSTDEQGRSGNGLAAQREAILKFASDNGYKVVEIVEEWASGKLGIEDRPVLAAAIAKAKRLDAYIVVSKLDRLSRQVEFIANLMNTRAKFIVTSLGEDVDSLMLHIYAAFAEKERTVIGERTKAALQALKAKGVPLGFALHKDPNTINVARANGCAANASKADAFAQSLAPILQNFIDRGLTKMAMAEELNRMGVKTARGGSWGAQTVINAIDRLNRMKATV